MKDAVAPIGVQVSYITVQRVILAVPKFGVISRFFNRQRNKLAHSDSVILLVQLTLKQNYYLAVLRFAQLTQAANIAKIKLPPKLPNIQ